MIKIIYLKHIYQNNKKYKYLVIWKQNYKTETMVSEFKFQIHLLKNHKWIWILNSLTKKA